MSCVPLAVGRDVTWFYPLNKKPFCNKGDDIQFILAIFSTHRHETDRLHHQHCLHFRRFRRFRHHNVKWTY